MSALNQGVFECNTWSDLHAGCNTWSELHAG